MPESIYTTNYFLNDCEGFKEYLNTHGLVLSRRLKKLLNLAQLKPGMSVLDVGCGRGELSLHCALLGARTIAADREADALTLARDALIAGRQKDRQIASRLHLVRSDCCALPFPPDFFDVVFLSDIVEHLNPAQLERTLQALHAVLKPAGKIVLHTSPNRIFAAAGLRVYWLIGLVFGVKLPWNMRRLLPPGCQKEVHPNEQTTFALRRSFCKAGFNNMRLWLEANPHYVYFFLKEDRFIKRLNFLYRLMPIKHLFFSEIWGIISKSRNSR